MMANHDQSGELTMVYPWCSWSATSCPPSIRYEEFPHQLTNTSVRLLVVPLADDVSLSEAGEAISKEILDVLLTLNTKVGRDEELSL